MTFRIKITPMSYQVLARQYRPKNFQTLVGQEHVVRALTHALEQQRLHHAYLFTGTRGVGKTTLSRILAKSFNCEQGITATPCGQCDACVAIDAGRFVDYIEMDAASNRGVDEMAQLLEQAVYAPSNARFKVYMIDEVHMLTNHAFNSMLKTLEEPPAHIKFILATTDPQKIPVTVLSRCLQFNLKQMPLPAIVNHLENILALEKIEFELPALRLLAQAAQGSMRDALSLTDQAIAYAVGKVSLDAVQGMLGALDQSYLINILDALALQDGPALLAVADQMLARSLSYKGALQDLATLLHQLSIAQWAPTAIAEDMPHRAELMRLAKLFEAEQIQLFYQIAVHGRNELGLAPDEYAGFSMTLLRMLAFRPVIDEAPILLSASKKTAAPSTSAQSGGDKSGNRKSAMATLDALLDRRSQSNTSKSTHEIESVKSVVPAALGGNPVGLSPMSAAEFPPKAAGTADISQQIQLHPAQIEEVQWDGDWPRLAAGLPLRGVAQQLAQQSELISCEKTPYLMTVALRAPLETLLAGGSVEKLTNSLSEYFSVPIKLTIEIGAVQKTAHAASVAVDAARQNVAQLAIENDHTVQGLMRVFGATIVPGSIKATN
jgi:DNA polymerase-3 subunit gamma/tau